MTDSPTPLALAGTTYQDAMKESRGDFLPHMYLLQGMSEAATEGKGKVGDFFCNDSTYGSEVEIVVLDLRWHATYAENKVKKMESYHKDSIITQEIKNIKRNVPNGIDNRFGWSWLVYLPQTREVVIFHPNTPSARFVSATLLKCSTPPDQRDPQDRAAPFTRHFILRSEMVQRNTSKYPVPVAEPIAMKSEVIETIDKDQIMKAIAQFQAPVKGERSVSTSSVAR